MIALFSIKAGEYIGGLIDAGNTEHFSFVITIYFHAKKGTKEIKVINIQEDHSTNLKFENIELDTGVEDKLFHEMYLKRLPQ